MTMAEIGAVLLFGAATATRYVGRHDHVEWLVMVSRI